ncbi:MAG: hypothetical protein Kow00109_05880 [Acidobacteriota bacterium]
MLALISAWPHGHVLLGLAEQLRLDQLPASRPSRQRRIVLALIIARSLRPETATSSLGLELGLEDVTDRELYAALDWLLARQKRIETKLSRRHLEDGTLLLYDVSGSYYTGRRPSLVQYGYSRDRKPAFPQIVYGLLCNADGCPIAIEVFSGDTADPATLGRQIAKIRRRFGLRRVVFVGDRGLVTSRRIAEELRPVEGLDWITALRADTIRRLAHQGVIQPSLFDERDLAEVYCPDFPGEPLVVCRNPLLADQRARRREELLGATARELDKIIAATGRERRPLRGRAKITLRVGKVLNRYKVAKHFELEITDESFTYRRNEARIAEEAALDGLYVIRTSVDADTLEAVEVVRAYKDLAQVERGFGR